MRSANDPAPLLTFPLWHARSILPVPDLCFLIMPLRERWIRRLYATHVPEVLKDVDLRPQHAGQRHGPVITEDIWTALNQARVVIAELTGTNPNVMYELGLAHTLGKPVVLMTSDRPQDIPFDLRTLRHVIYERTPAGVRSMKTQLRNHLANLLEEYPSGYPLAGQTEVHAQSWAHGYREWSSLCSVERLNQIRDYLDTRHLSEIALSYCATSACYHNCVGNMIFWGQLCDSRPHAAEDLVFSLFAQHGRTRLRVAQVLATMSPTTHRGIVSRMLEHAVQADLRAAVEGRNVLNLISERYRDYALTPERRDQMITELSDVRW